MFIFVHFVHSGHQGPSGRPILVKSASYHSYLSYGIIILVNGLIMWRKIHCPNSVPILSHVYKCLQFVSKNPDSSTLTGTMKKFATGSLMIGYQPVLTLHPLRLVSNLLIVSFPRSLVLEQALLPLQHRLPLLPMIIDQ